MVTNNRDYWRKGSKASKKNFDKRSFAYDPKEFRSAWHSKKKYWPTPDNK